MAELKDEQQWTEQFESTTDEQWDKIADMARREIAALSGEKVRHGESTPIC
ncbi:MAG: hypothetical protein MUC48_23395 [Leptolyngbya sp. Prado105]|jgi:hypothetical protein|nr:hypothetical protein [Leptolyngbya sp. Prado105]